MDDHPDEWGITAEGLVKQYGEARALDGFDLEVAAGTICGLLGPNGAGKTTAVRILATLLRPDGGTARVAGADVLAEAHEVRRRIGLSGQTPAVDEILSGRQNLVLFGRLNGLTKPAARGRAEQLLDQLELTDAGDRPVKQYSGGMRRRLDLAVTLIQAPAVLFLDEPTTGLDVAARRALWEGIRTFHAEGGTVVLTSHYLEEIEELAERVVVLGHGRVLADDTVDAVRGLVAVRRVSVAAGTLPTLEGVVSMEYADGRTHLVTADSDRLVRDLVASGVPFSDLEIRATSLEEAFLTLTASGVDR